MARPDSFPTDTEEPGRTCNSGIARAWSFLWPPPVTARSDIMLVYSGCPAGLLILQIMGEPSGVRETVPVGVCHSPGHSIVVYSHETHSSLEERGGQDQDYRLRRILSTRSHDLPRS